MPPPLFPYLQSVFLTRLILQFLPLRDLLSVTALLSKTAYDLAFDCSMLRSLSLSPSDRVNLSYDLQDYLLHYLRKLKRRDQLKALDLRLLFRHEELEPALLRELVSFPNLSSLYLGEYLLTPSSFDLFKKIPLSQLTSLQVPKIANQKQFLTFFEFLKTEAPLLSELHFSEVSDFEVPLLQHQAECLLQIPLKSLSFSMAGTSNVLSMEALISHIYPRLRRLSISQVALSFIQHREALLSLLTHANGLLEQLQINAHGPEDTLAFHCGVSSLRKLKLSHFSLHFASICAWVESNLFLEQFLLSSSLFFPPPQIDLPRTFQLANLKYLRLLHLQGVFYKVYLQNLPVLCTLHIQTPHDQLQLCSFPGRSLQLCSVLAHVSLQQQQEHRLLFTRAEFNQDNAMSGVLLLSNLCMFAGLRYMERLTTCNPDVEQVAFLSPKLRCLRYCSSASCPAYVEEILDEVEARCYKLKELSLDYSLAIERSHGCFKWGIGRLLTLHLKAITHLEGPLTITKEAASLQQFELEGVAQLEGLLIEAPCVQVIKLQGLKQYNWLRIRALTGYQLFLRNGRVDISECPGMGHLSVEHNWSGKENSLISASTNQFYPRLRTLQFKALTSYSNIFFHKFIKTAPNLRELIISFGVFVNLEDDEKEKIRREREDEPQVPWRYKELWIKHPNVEWVTLLRGFQQFRVIYVDESCTSLRLLKVREFDYYELVNETKAKIAGEKNAIEGDPL